MKPVTTLARATRFAALGGGVLLAIGAACSSAPPGPFFGDENFLVVGVNPDSEADALAVRLRSEGLHEHLRLRGKTFTALGVADAQGVPSIVRVMTVRGIALALDPVESDPFSRGARYELLAPAEEGVLDADGDGFEELLVMRRTYDQSEACLLAYRVQNAGFVDALSDANAVRALGARVRASAEPCAIDAGDAGVDAAAPD